MTALLLLIPAGLALGILINYFADVLPYTRRLSTLVCAFCGTELRWRHYLSFSPCPNCGKKRRVRNWLVPLLSAGLVSLFWYKPPLHIGFWLGVILLAYFALVAITDLEYHAILNPVSMVGVIIGIGAGLARHTWWETLLGGAAGFGAMLLLFFVGRWFGRYMSRRRGVPVEDEEALGFGDVYLTGILGLILGWPAITAGLFAGIMLAGLAGGLYLIYTLITHRYQAGVFLPYAPFLVLGAILILYPPW